ncbi:HD domain-containing protein [Mariniblastus fucicola]|uniref:Cyclic di-GMP phosphodiesterase response regulator RpfG n=1 Tax=Mariniblastus fucicola TaxID=980251 RepID=A0A5B9PHN8_9BACT|nr:response regulator [Mariniblastus fucicola]QEG22391.1 Cyclic di-GMP phosphodiesterase response regulator RpfG [Mariniblastus fucicola]
MPVVSGSGLPSPFSYPRSTDHLVKQAKILVIDDDEPTTEVIRKYLQSSDFHNIKTLNDSKQAIGVIHQYEPDLVLLDLMMPVSGAYILSQIRSDREICNTPVLALTSAASEETRTKLLNLGANDFLNKPIVANELFARVRNTLSSKVAYDELKQQSEQLKQDVLRDTLTNTANRRAFDFELNRKMLEWSRQRTHFALLIIDIDHFKKINDTFGHQPGDKALKFIAETISSKTREIDLVCRIGGEEFAVIMPVSNKLESTRAAERIRREVESQPIVMKGQKVYLTISIGVTNTLKGDDSSLIFRRGDAALYGSKQNGRNCSTFHDGSGCIAVENVTKERTPRQVHITETPEPLNVTSSKVMIIDDEPSTAIVVKKYLKTAGFERLLVETDSTKAVDRIVKERPDILLLDIHMPEVSGMEILEQIRKIEATASTPVVFLTSSTDPELRVKALNLGANDFLNKPVVVSELVARVRNTLLAKAHVDLLAGYSAQLEQQVEARTAELIASRREAIQCLARAAELRDDITGKHVIRVGRYAAIIARELGFTPQQVIDLEHAAQLHDVGKIGIPDAILNKPQNLTHSEFEMMKNHCRTGSRIISGEKLDENKSLNQVRNIVDECSSPVMRLAALVAETHHEKWDGSGYPHGLAGEDIPMEGRITAICDVFDAISTKRPYKEAYPVEKCFQILLEGSGKHFDPAVVDAFFRRRSDILEAFEELSD